MPKPRVLFENVSIKRNKIIKRIQFIQDNLGYSVLETELIENRYAPIGAADVWKTTYFFPDATRELARTALIGRISMVGYEEGNTDPKSP